jgi:hypothetical protein
MPNLSRSWMEHELPTDKLAHTNQHTWITSEILVFLKKKNSWTKIRKRVLHIVSQTCNHFTMACIMGRLTWLIQMEDIHV